MEVGGGRHAGGVAGHVDPSRIGVAFVSRVEREGRPHPWQDVGESWAGGEEASEGIRDDST